MINFILILFILFFGHLSQSKTCTNLNNIYSVYFINGVGNNSETRLDSSNKIKHKLKIEKINQLTNPKNEGIEDILFKNHFKQTLTWGELKEVFSQKREEILKSKIIDEATVKKMYSQLDDSKVNLIIAHSQGNLYANSLCKLNNGRKKQINIAIASPASSVDCGDKNNYVTLEEDSVIGSLSEFSRINPLSKKPLSPNLKISNKGSLACSTDDIMCHGLIETYLTIPVSLNKIKSLYQKNIDLIEEQELNFNLIDIKLSELKQENKNLLSSSKNSIQSSYNNLNMKYRKNLAAFRTVGYLSNVFNSSFFSSITKLNINGLNKKDFNKILNQEIEVNSDQEYADLVGYIMDHIHPYCLKNSSFIPKNLSNYCKNYIPYYSLNEFLDNPMFSKFSLEAKHFEWNTLNKSLTLNCKKALEIKQSEEILIKLKYTPEQGVISSISINELNFDIYPKNLSNKASESEDVAKVFIKINEDKYEYSFNRITDFINYKKTNLVATDKFNNCNSLNKLLSNKCKDYLTSLLSSR